MKPNVIVDSFMPLPLNSDRVSIEEYYAYTGEERVELIFVV